MQSMKLFYVKLINLNPSALITLLELSLVCCHSHPKLTGNGHSHY